MILEDDRVILHDLTGVNLIVDFFLGTREELQQGTKCMSYSICWESVNVHLYSVTVTEQISELDFFYNIQQLFVDDQLISGDVINFMCDNQNGNLTATCTIALGRDY